MRLGTQFEIKPVWCPMCYLLYGVSCRGEFAMSSVNLQGQDDTSVPALPARSGDVPPDSLIFGSSAPMDVIRRKVEKFAGANVPVLIQGESGTGKGMLARYIHSRSATPYG